MADALVGAADRFRTIECVAPRSRAPDRGIIDPMGFLRRLLGGAEPGVTRVDEGSGDPDMTSPADADAAERMYEAALLREEQERLDELVQRQLRYADYAWQPPAEGGERRADDGDRE